MLVFSVPFPDQNGSLHCRVGLRCGIDMWCTCKPFHFSLLLFSHFLSYERMRGTWRPGRCKMTCLSQTHKWISSRLWVLLVSDYYSLFEFVLFLESFSLSFLTHSFLCKTGLYFTFFAGNGNSYLLRFSFLKVALTFFTHFILCLIPGLLYDSFGISFTVFVGGLSSSLGYLIMSFGQSVNLIPHNFQMI